MVILARTAILLAVEEEDNEITTFLQDYIRRKSNRNIHEISTNDETPVINKRPEVDEIEKPVNDKTPINDKIPANNKTPTNNEISVNGEKPVNEISAINKRLISNDVYKINSNINTELENNDQIDENEDKTEQDNKIIKTNLKSVKNLNKITNKGRSSKRWYCSIEKEQGSRGGSKTRGSYRCRVCNQVGYNAAFHKSVAINKRLISNDVYKINSNINTELENNDQIDENEDKTEQDNKIIKTNLKSVKNLNKITNKGRSSKRWYCSIEKEQGSRGGSKTRGSYRCRVCNQVGYNAAFHKSVGK
ncbi:hypothetical protein Glove_51g1 [Diversispora epigaea]|uniref:Uncharacterized protein n=1 Tax=Diversispora epigaea TaxID=1348612 RepID=A0A397JFR7_9GLOM|nr:hypothetical protein Glove_51g1 [Diversispora epigaea]